MEIQKSLMHLLRKLIFGTILIINFGYIHAGCAATGKIEVNGIQPPFTGDANTNVLSYRIGNNLNLFFSPKYNPNAYGITINTINDNQPSLTYNTNINGCEAKSSHYSCNVVIPTPTKEANYNNFSITIFDQHNNQLETFYGAVPKIEASLQSSEKNGHYDALVITNTSDSTIKNLKIENGGHIIFAENELILIKPHKSISIKFKVTVDQKNPNKADLIKISYLYNNQTLYYNIAFNLGESHEIATKNLHLGNPLFLYADNANNPITVIATRAIDLKKGNYRIELLLANKTADTNPIQLSNNYSIKLLDENGKKIDLKIDPKKITYGPECSNGMLTDDECLLTIEGSTKDKNIYTSFALDINHSNGTKTIIGQLGGELGLDNEPILELSKSGYYHLSLKNNAKQEIVVLEVRSPQQCISLHQPIINSTIAHNNVLNLKLEPTEYQPTDECNGQIIIKYTTPDSSEVKTSIIPINMMPKQEGFFSNFWQKHKTTIIIVGVTIVIIAASAIYIYSNSQPSSKILESSALTDTPITPNNPELPQTGIQTKIPPNILTPAKQIINTDLAKNLGLPEEATKEIIGQELDKIFMTPILVPPYLEKEELPKKISEEMLSMLFRRASYTKYELSETSKQTKEKSEEDLRREKIIADIDDNFDSIFKSISTFEKDMGLGQESDSESKN